MKITNWILLALGTIGFVIDVSAQYDYGLTPINTREAYEASLIDNPNARLKDLAQEIEGIQLDIKYSTSENFTGKVIYREPRAFLRQEAASALAAVQKQLKKKGYGLKIFDAYRPYSVTIIFYELYLDTAYVASPYTGSRHNRGAAVDLTLFDLKTGVELDMGTPFDEFTEQSSPLLQDLPEEIMKNRTLLRSVMEKNGFSIYPTEWWHFDFKGWEEYDILDVPFDQLD
ncbi:MAG: D-alanyl-D-alanine dipeptidase [Flavobacteriales bacterium]|nr:D-alanyl-D-alanine dipeptidase [Flavobacteriales bacterium]